MRARQKQPGSSDAVRATHLLTPRLSGSITSLTVTTVWSGPVLEASTRLEREIVIATDDRTSSAQDRGQETERHLALGHAGSARADSTGRP
jgi:hypothetical protein